MRAYLSCMRLICDQFVEYGKMVYLDADIQVYENIDELFDLPDGHFYAVMDCFCERTWSHTPQYRVGYCQQCPERVAWPAAELGPPPSLYFNAGMFVFEPSIATADALLATLKVTEPTPFAEQDFLNMFFRDIYKPIPLVYNLVLAMLWRHPENVELDKVKVVHYCAAGSKPWRYTGEGENMDRADIKELVRRWWDVYNDESLNYKKPAAVLDGGSVVAVEAERRPFLAALSEAGTVKYIKAPSAA
ncbi:galactinol synthase 1 isoform X2 [Elaeis guineensis]|uniref:galactinol synthase 1 isoform X2 n=1 Tax=Elaeis guineensis var. tenera TaxID=51953 RepID=UPI003C6D0EDE